MPYDPITGKRLRGRPSNAERAERPDIFETPPPNAGRRAASALPKGSLTGKRRRGRPTREEHQECLRLALEAVSQGTTLSRVDEEYLLLQAARVLRPNRGSSEAALFSSVTGLRAREYAQLVLGQNGRCAICSATCGRFPASRHSAFVPDVGVAGRVLGLLCPTCHAALMLLRRDEDMLRRAANYIHARSEVADGPPGCCIREHTPEPEIRPDTNDQVHREPPLPAMAS